MIDVYYLSALGGSGLQRFKNLIAIMDWLEEGRSIGQPRMIIRMVPV